MSHRGRIYIRFLVVFVMLGAAGIVAVAYTLVQQRFSLPFASTYQIRAAFPAANGVLTGIGQPVDVSGVGVGQVVGLAQRDGQAIVTLQIDRGSLPRVYADANAVLDPITPLGDMQVDLDPGHRAAGAMPRGGLIAIGQTTSPVPLSDLLSTLDSDTRDYLTSLVASLSQGTAGRGPDIRRILHDLGPTTAAAGEISHALAARRAALAQLVHNLSRVAGAAASDHQLATIVAAGDATVRAIAAQEGPLRQAVAELPQTLTLTRSTLSGIVPFARQLGPTLTALEPSVQRLPATLTRLSGFSAVAERSIAQGLEPFTIAALPLARQLVPAVSRLRSATPNLAGSFQVLDYLVNELAYNPNIGDNQGFLFWIPWFFHNLNSVTSFADANGGIGRAAPIVTCYGVQDIKELQQLFNVAGLCPS